MSNIRSNDEAPKIAAAQNCDVVKGDGFTLLVDLDTKADQQVFQRMFEMLNSNVGEFTIKDQWVSKSGRGKHVVVQSKNSMSVPERLLLQACLGSDRKREMLGYARLKAGAPKDQLSLLFRPKEPVAERTTKGSEINMEGRIEGDGFVAELNADGQYVVTASGE